MSQEVLKISKIQRLSPHVVNQIAAGEVIENAASVIKELVDNAIDAKATRITVELEQAGRSKICICDDGSGMPPEDLLLCIESHATSKLSSAEDLDKLFTLGFRGEAIPSIASISRMRIASYPRTPPEMPTLLPHEVRIEGGNLLGIFPSTHQRYGTLVEVKDLFFNAPVRQRFQKKPSSDLIAIEHIITQFALAHPHISFYLISDGKPLLELAAPIEQNQNGQRVSSEISKNEIQGPLGQRIIDLLGFEFFQQLLPIAPRQFSSGASIIGFIGSPLLHKANRRGQYLIINRRATDSSFISEILKEAYATTLPQNRFPVAILHISLPPADVDINVHPQKSQVRLANEEQLSIDLKNAVASALNPPSSAATLHSSSQSEPLRIFSSPMAFQEISDEEQIIPISWRPLHFDAAPALGPSFASKIPSAPPSFSREEPPLPSQEPTPYPAPHKDPLAHPISGQWHAVAPVPPSEEAIIDSAAIPFTWQRAQTLGYIHPYLLLQANTLPKRPPYFPEGAQGIAILHVPGARSRLLYEESCAALEKEKTVYLQNLLSPLNLSFSLSEVNLLNENIHLLRDLGFHLASSGPSTFFLEAIPAYCHVDECQQIISDLLHKLARHNTTLNVNQDVLEKKRRSLAQEAARSVAHHATPMGVGEERQLLERLMLTSNPFYSALGQPLFSLLGFEELERRFKSNSKLIPSC
jgi:DNA mismatch repair protein MutL